MIGITKKFNDAKNSLIEIDKQVKMGGFLPTRRGRNEYTLETLERLEKALLKEEFTISIVGQINAGKTTFLNALLFNREILPESDTPNTAQLTIIKYGKEDRFEVHFYNRNEWERIKENKNDYEKYIKPNVDRSIISGVTEEDIIKDKRKKISQKDLKGLKEYVSSEGKYMPFVHHVVLYNSSPLLKDCKIVDTPGINDPNIIRSQVTEEHIIDSTAIVYILYNRGLDLIDEDFIDQYLRTVTSEKILFALNKIDLLNNIESVNDFVKNTLMTGKLKERNLIDNEKQISLISAKAALLKFKEERGDTLTDNDIFYRDKIKKQYPDLIDNYGNIKDIEENISKYLMKNKGNGIIESHKTKIREICGAKIKEYENKINEKEGYIEILRKKINGTLSQEKEEIKEDKEQIKEAFEKYNLRMQDEVKDKKEEIINYIRNTLLIKIKKEIENRLIGLDVKEIEIKLVSTIIEVLNKNLLDDDFIINQKEWIKFYRDILKKYNEYIEQGILKRKSDLAKQYKIDRFDIYKIENEFNKIQENLTSESKKITDHVKKLNLEKKTAWTIKNTPIIRTTDKENTRKSYINYAKSIAEQIVKYIEEYYIGQEQIVKYAIEDLETEIKRKIQNYQNQIAEAEKKTTNAKEEILNIQNDIIALKEEKDNFTNKAKDIENLLNLIVIEDDEE